MGYASLYELISLLQHRTKLHIGVSFFQDSQNELLAVPRAHTIHVSPVCETIKAAQNGYISCRECRLHATDRVIRERKPFFRFCHGGILEYTQPICDGENLLGILFIGNLYVAGEESAPLRALLAEQPDLEATMERTVTREECRRIGHLLESYILLIQKRSPTAMQGSSLSDRIKHFLDNNLEYELDTHQIGLLLHYNEKYLGRIFKKETGLSVWQYRNRRRLDLCREFLVHSNEPISRIACRLGFENISYFNRLYKSQYGLSPTEYRKTHQKKPSTP